MLTPSHFVGNGECILIIALNPKNASAKYKKIKEILSSANYHILDTLNPCIIAHVNAEHFLALTGQIELLLDKGDVISIIAGTEKGLDYRVLMRRLDTDREIREILGCLWDIPWTK